MLNQLSDIAPRAALAAAAAWGVMHYFVIGPETAERIVRADFVPVCEANFRDRTIKAAQQRIATLPKPALDPVNEAATDQLRSLRNAPWMGDLNRMGLGGLLGIDTAMDMAGAQIEAKRRVAEDAYRRVVDQIEAATATELGKAGSVCGCVADAAIADTRARWAVFSGTLGLIRPAPLRAFDEKMMQVQASGVCAANGQVAR